MYNHSKMLERIKTEKKKQGITNAQLSALTTISIGTLNKILSGDSKDPQISFIIRIAKALQVSADYLIFGEDKFNMTNKDEDEGISLYQNLDTEDKAEIRGEMKQMLKAKKYETKTPEKLSIAEQFKLADLQTFDVAAYGKSVTKYDKKD